MGPLPVEVAAARAATEGVHPSPGGGGHEVGDLLLVHRLQHAVASQAAGVGAGPLLQLEPGRHFDQLLPGTAGPHVVAVGQGAVPEQIPIPGEQDAPLGHRQGHQVGVVEGGVVDGVESEEAEVAGEPGEMVVGDESGLPERGGTDPDDGSDVEGLEHGIHRHPVAVVDAVREVDRLPVDQDQVHLGVGYPAALDQILDPGGQVELHGHPPVGRVHQVGELGVETELGSPPSHRRVSPVAPTLVRSTCPAGRREVSATSTRWWRRAT